MKPKSFVTRVAVVLVGIGLVACTTQTTSGDGTRVKFTVAANGSVPGYQVGGQPTGIVARTRGAALDALGTSAVATWLNAFPFDTSAAVIVLGGQRPTGGYKVDVDRLERQGSKLNVTGSIDRPPGDASVMQAITEPYVALQVAMGDVDGVTTVTVALKE